MGKLCNFFDRNDVIDNLLHGHIDKNIITSFSKGDFHLTHSITKISYTKKNFLNI